MIVGIVVDELLTDGAHYPYPIEENHCQMERCQCHVDWEFIVRSAPLAPIGRLVVWQWIGDHSVLRAQDALFV